MVRDQVVVVKPLVTAMPYSATEFWRKLRGGASAAAASVFAAPGKLAEFISDVGADQTLLGPVDTPDSSWLVQFAFVVRGRREGLQITFKSGATCFYPGTTDEQFWSLARAQSRGRWVHANIYGNQYIIV
jgi:hypothetical protein